MWDRRVFVEKHEGRTPIRSLRRRWDFSVRMNLKAICVEGDLLRSSDSDRAQWRHRVNGNEITGSVKYVEFFNYLKKYYRLRKYPAPWNFGKCCYKYDIFNPMRPSLYLMYNLV